MVGAHHAQMRPVAEPPVEAEAEVVEGPLHDAGLVVGDDALEQHFFARNHRHVVRLLDEEGLVAGLGPRRGGQQNRDRDEEPHVMIGSHLRCTRGNGASAKRDAAHFCGFPNELS